MTIQVYPAPKSQVTSNLWRYTATGGETTLTGVDNAGTSLYYYPNQELVYLNGILLVRGVDYTATSGTSITGLAALTAGDYVQVNCYSNFTITQVPVTSLQGSVQNLQLANSSITIGGQTISLGGSQNTFSGITLTAPTLNNAIVGTQYTTSVPLTVKGAAGQAVNLQEWQNSSGTPISVVDASGNIGIKYSSPAASLHVQKTGALLQTVAIFDNGQSTGNSGAPDAIKIGFANNGSIKGSINVGTYGNDYIGFNTGTDTERVRIDAAGNLGVNTTTPGTFNPDGAYNRVASIKAGDQVITLGSYWQAGVGQNSYINSSQSTAATNASNLIFQTGRTEAMRMDTSQNVMVGTTTPIGKFTVAGALSTTTFSPDYTLSLASATTYSANTAYSLGTITFPSFDGNNLGAFSFFCQLLISMDNTNYHTYAGAFILPLVWWKANGTTQSISVVLEQHNGNNANATITLPITGSSQGVRAISFQTDQSITVSSGGSVKLLMKRMF
jgi:hypothetical protein